MFKLAPIAGGTTVIAAAAVIDQNTDGADGTTGQVHYNWGTADTRTAGAGLFIGEFETTFASGAIESFPNDGYFLVGITGDL